MQYKFQISYYSMREQKMGTYDLMAIDVADAVHTTLRQFPYLIVFSAKVVL